MVEYHINSTASLPSNLFCFPGKTLVQCLISCYDSDLRDLAGHRVSTR